MSTPVVCVPMKLDAFVLNPALCKPLPEATVAPITQPNYTFLRLNQNDIQSDLLNHVDLHAATDCTTNPRVFDLGTGAPITGRTGVYLHWSLPRFYRTGVSAMGDMSDTGRKKAEAERRKAAGFSNVPDTDFDPNVPDFRPVPNRWLIVRRLFLDSVFPETARTAVGEFKAWIIESDRLDNIDKISTDVDIEVEYAPYVTGDGTSLAGQAENFIGLRLDAIDSKGELWKDVEDTVARVPLSVLNSSNPLFADYTPHNANVFSMLDPFDYLDGTQTAKLDSATASYYVIGWHSNGRVEGDPFTIPPDPTHPASQPTRGTRVDGCNMKFSESTEGIKDWLKSSDSCRTLCHGSMYSVRFSATKKPDNSPADKAASLLANTSPVTVGTTPLDTILGFVDAHINDGQFSADKDAFQKLQKLEPLLLKQEETVDAQFEAADMLSDHNFIASVDSDSHWHLSGQNTDGQPTKPTQAQLDALAELNQYQEAMDQAARELRQERWNLWAQWWTYFSFEQDQKKDDTVKKEVLARSQHIAALTQQVNDWNIYINGDPATGKIGKAATLPCEKGARQRFYSLKDPTMLVSGMESPWPTDYTDKLAVRLDTQIVPYTTKPTNPFLGWSGFLDFIRGSQDGKIPAIAHTLPTTALQATADKLLCEFFMLHPPDSPADKYKPDAGAAIPPLYHDDGDVGSTRDCWINQPWFPLFVEWEADYYHIPFKNWDFEQVSVLNAPSRFRYGLKDNVQLPGSTGIVESPITLFGRMLVLPQPAFSLADKIKTLFARMTTQDLDALIEGADARDKLIEAVKQLPFLSAPMAGFNDHLITRLQGTHVKPTQRAPASTIRVMDSSGSDKSGQLDTALKPSAGFDRDQILQMDVNTSTTPYANSVSYPADFAASPFKPVSHGQFHFTRLNVIDKFGQAATAIDPRPHATQLPLYPVLSEYYRPQLLPDNATPNTVIREDAVDHNQFAQMPPNINQDARLNACFLVRDLPTQAQPTPPWRPATEWESPIWGWIVVNHVDHGLQLYLPDGTFYREVRRGGVGGDTIDPAWKPFDRPTALDAEGSGAASEYTLPLAQLNALLAKLRDRMYLQAFMDMVDAALTALPHPPAEYAHAASVVVGRPLALVNTGWSLELAAPPLTNMSTQATAPAKQLLEDYAFPLRLGDGDRVYDGLVGYWEGLPAAPTTPATGGLDPSPSPSTPSGPAVGSETKLESIMTHFPSNLPGSPTHRITTQNLPKLTPYYIPNVVQAIPAPAGTPPPSGSTIPPFTTKTMAPSSLHQQHSSRFTVIPALVDPYTPLHAYTGILPITTLQIPPWAVSSALRRMAAFFAVGPLVVPRLRDTYVEAEKLDAWGKYAHGADGGGGGGNVPVGTGVPLPVAGGEGEWLWLQPFNVGSGDGEKETEYNALGIEVTDGQPRFEKGPYTAVSGFLQMRQTLDAQGS